GAALGLQVWACGACWIALAFQITLRGGWIPVAAAAHVAVAAAALAIAGGLVRALWGALMSLVAALANAIVLAELSQLLFKFDHPDLMRAYLLGSVASGMIASLAGAALAWRSASSRLGTLRSLVS